jgi:hypothetical protein
LAFGQTPYNVRVRLWVQKPVDLNSNINANATAYGPDGKQLSRETCTEMLNPASVHADGLQIFDHLVDVYPCRDKPVPRFEKVIFTIGSSWPLEVRIPLSDAKKKLLLTPRKPWTLKLLSVKVRKANSEEISNYGSDTVVDAKFVMPPSQAGTNHYAEDVTDGLEVECDYKDGTMQLSANELNGHEYGDVSISSDLEQLTLDGVDTEVRTWSYQLKLNHNIYVPAKGRMTFKTAVSVDNCQAQPIFAVLRPS